jgi:dUTP pyrophosphatase
LRSSRAAHALKRGLIVANGVGVVDPDYCGPEDEVKILAMNVTDRSVIVKRGDRIAQGIVLAAPRIEWRETERTAGASRGGFGATGTA